MGDKEEISRAIAQGERLLSEYLEKSIVEKGPFMLSFYEILLLWLTKSKGTVKG